MFVFTQVEPFLMFALRRRITDEEAAVTAEEEADVVPAAEVETKTEPALTAEVDTMGDPLDVLSQRERDVAELICLGYANKDIATMLFISDHTVKDHVKSIYRKTNVHSRLELAALVNGYRVANKK